MSDYPLLTEKAINHLKFLSEDYALAHGLVMRHPTVSSAIIHAPFTLFPSAYPKSCFQNAIDIQKIFNKLIDKLSRDDKLIRNVMEELSIADDFMKKTYEIYKKVADKPSVQTITLGLHRSDYLIHMEVSNENSKPKPVLQQVELNTIAASFSSLSTRVSELHQFLAKSGNYVESDVQQKTKFDFDYNNMPINNSIEAIPKGLAEAWKLYKYKQGVVMMIVQPNERNSFDQRQIEYKLNEKYGVQLIRKTLKEVFDSAKIVNGELMIDNKIVCVTSARLLIEESRTVKCPNIQYHIVGSKKIQQILATPGVVERYLEDPAEVKLIRSCFTGLYPLDNSMEGKEAIKKALATPEKFVMKPQREGGGNNVYGLDIPPVISKLNELELNGYILMDLIQTPDMSNVMVKQGEISVKPVISELGIYGVWVSDENEVYINEDCGHLVRTKNVGVTEGGVATGFSVLDSPLLVEDALFT
ncbi:hypothetical protein HK099_005613 [Clydaea vesicula]|uniref:Glutathione synthetase n=1 Tax=Clydaea vesicula TaxID=447962 RepID=A0AAD5U025_9FUNG|nr:hypothetical protein HK099_005613 [Clydaea vesicula]